MRNNGFILIHRRLMNKAFYSRPQYLALWLHLLLKATYSGREYIINGKTHTLKPGEFIASRKTLGLEVGIKESTIETILLLFEKDGQIKQQKTNRYRVISIVSWNEYQNLNNKITTKQHPSNNQPTTNQQPNNTNKEGNKENKEKESNKVINNVIGLPFDLFWNGYQKKVDRKKSESLWQKLNEETQNVILDYLPGYVQSTPNVKYRKNPDTFLRNKSWENEIIIDNGQKTNTISQELRDYVAGAND